MTSRWLLLGAATVVCATNLGALGLGALNRRDAPDTAIALTERELRFRDFGEESTATLFGLEWVARDDAGFPCDRMRPLGFSCPDTPVRLGSDDRSLRQPQRNGYAVLEYDGAAWQQVVKQREAHAADSAARNTSHYPASQSLSVERSDPSRCYRHRCRCGGSAAHVSERDSLHHYSRSNRPQSTSGPPPMHVTTLRLHRRVAALDINVPRPFPTIVREAVATRSGQPPESWTPRYTVDVAIRPIPRAVDRGRAANPVAVPLELSEAASVVLWRYPT